MKKEIIHTNNAPKAIGVYSQAVKVDNVVYLSGQIGLNHETMELVPNLENQIEQVFKNLKAVIEASGGTFENVVKLNIYLTDMTSFAIINQVMTKYFQEPYPARAVIGVKDLPKGALVEADAIVVL